MPVRPSVHMEEHGSQNPRLYLVTEIRRVSHGTCSYMFRYINEVVNSVTSQLHLRSKFYYVIVQFKIKQIYIPSGSAPFEWIILGAQLSQRPKSTGSKMLRTICSAFTSFSKATVVVVNGREDKNEQNERGRRTEIRKRLKGKGDKRCVEVQKRTTNFWRQLMFMRISEPLPRKYVWLLIAWNSWCGTSSRTVPIAARASGIRLDGCQSRGKNGTVGRWHRSPLPWVRSK